MLADLAAVLQKLALLQAVPDLQLDEAEDIETYQRLAGALSPEDVQLFYQIAIVGRRDLELAPDVRGGFEMTLLRMLAFRLAEGAQVQPSSAARCRRKLLATVAAAARAASAQTGAARAARSERLAGDGRADESAGHGQGARCAHARFAGKQGNKVQLVLDADGEHFRRPQLEEKLAQALSCVLRRAGAARAVGRGSRARHARAPAEGGRRRSRAAGEGGDRERSERARDARQFGATVQPDSVRPTE